MNKTRKPAALFAIRVKRSTKLTQFTLRTLINCKLYTFYILVRTRQKLRSIAFHRFCLIFSPCDRKVEMCVRNNTTANSKALSKH